MPRRLPANNLYAPPESPDFAVQPSGIPAGNSWVVDSDLVLTRGDVTGNWLCFETSVPVTPDSRLLFVKVFAPTPQKQIVFRISNLLTQLLPALGETSTYHSSRRPPSSPDFIR